jgi:hypothetical protein
MAVAAPPRPDTDELRAVIEHLAGITRPPASQGEREAAEWIAERLRKQGLDPRVEEEPAHGTYWWPLGILAGLGLLGGVASLRGRRWLGVALGAFAAPAMYDDVTGGAQWFRRRFLPQRTTWNVVAEAGDPEASQTLVLLAHHDAANQGVVFDPGPSQWYSRAFPWLAKRQKSWPPLFIGMVGGPALVALGSLLRDRGAVRAGAGAALLTLAGMIDIGRRSSVPGANDNLTAVAVLIALARALRERPVEGLRVLLVSCGAEESLQEGMQGFARRHFPALSPLSTRVLCLETLGSGDLTLAESEGMVVRRHFDRDLKDLVWDCARAAGVRLQRGYHLVFASDGLIALRAGYRTALLGSLNEHKVPANYHWPTDVPENVDYDGVADSVTLTEAVIRRLAADGGSTGE